MQAINWARSYSLKNPMNQKQMEDAIQSLSEGKLGDMDDYSQEAFTKTFCEGILHLEGNLLYGNDIHPHKAERFINPTEYKRKYKEVEKIVANSIERQKRLYLQMINSK
ncbi:hypothetical protein QTG56_24500 (plasmid) [Rossellomorea sp. AcN35-11]|nr:hypothetical protein [Rossellomorea aquimaris]WJV31796.1 hypothetical protein QTG56_24500 [Rossellomorea sp. AcN35-11]